VKDVEEREESLVGMAFTFAGNVLEKKQKSWGLKNIDKE
jgi:hypothetical protein